MGHFELVGAPSGGVARANDDGAAVPTRSFLGAGAPAVARPDMGTVEVSDADPGVAVVARADAGIANPADADPAAAAAERADTGMGAVSAGSCREAGPLTRPGAGAGANLDAGPSGASW